MLDLPWSELAALALSAFAAATILPFPSEAAYVFFLKMQPQAHAAALITATVANTLGGMTSFYLGYLLYKKKPLPADALWGD
jgi:membrane protein YqaA with SNARE-associated domain